MAVSPSVPWLFNPLADAFLGEAAGTLADKHCGCLLRSRLSAIVDRGPIIRTPNQVRRGHRFGAYAGALRTVSRNPPSNLHIDVLCPAGNGYSRFAAQVAVGIHRSVYCWYVHPDEDRRSLIAGAVRSRVPAVSAARAWIFAVYQDTCSITKVPCKAAFFGNVTGTPVRQAATTRLCAVATQGAWRIPTETICSFQAAILQTLTGPFGGWAR